jgi:uncharacterized protein YhaN
MNKSYICSYHVPISSSWESRPIEVSKSPDDLEDLLQQSHEDIDSLREKILRLTDELRMAKINKEVAERKTAVLTTLIDEVSALRREDDNSAFENPDQKKNETADLKSRREPKHRKIGILSISLAILVLAVGAAFVFISQHEPVVVAQLTTFLNSVMGVRFH